jgi:pyruvate kinase
MRRAKIVCTMGPAVETPEKVRELIAAGMNMARLNLSHGGYEEHQARLDQVRAAALEAGKPVAILVDLQGPKIRLGRFANGPHDLARGDIFTITTDEISGTKERVGTTYKGLPGDCKAGDRILIDDGKVTVEVIEVKGNDVITKCIQPGAVSNNKGINLPGVAVSVPAMSEKDGDDLRWGLRAGADFIALSFVRSAADVKDVHAIMDEVGFRVPIIAKIEKPQAVENLVEIVEAFDGIMVARGDLGVEVPMENVPLIQKMLVKKCLEASIPIIIATQMMESMITNYNATRAEVNDVANAMMDGADAVMLSGETSVGKFPVRVIETVQKILARVEAFEGIYHKDHKLVSQKSRMLTDAICMNAVQMAEQTETAAIVAMTHSGYTAFRISSFRPKANVYIFTGNETLLNTLSLVWGVRGFYYDKMVSTDHTISDIKDILKKGGYIKSHDLLINVASIPMHEFGKSNMLKISFVE